jgi:hypothetical protein
MQMHVARRLSEAIGSWVHLEFCCYRAGLFSENSLKAAVGSVLSAFPISAKGARVYADFAHEALNPVAGRGRKRDVDFALTLAGTGLSKRNAQIVVETKWAGSTHCTCDNILQDFLRLAVIKRAEPPTVCIFVLAGSHRELTVCLQGMPFTSSGKRNTGIAATGSEKRLKPDPSSVEHRRCFGETIKQLAAAGFTVPGSFVSRAHGLHPRQTDHGTVDFQAIAWELTQVSASELKPARW